jgi:hypothetical protein
VRVTQQRYAFLEVEHLHHAVSKGAKVVALRRGTKGVHRMLDTAKNLFRSLSCRIKSHGLQIRKPRFDSGRGLQCDRHFLANSAGIMCRETRRRLFHC